MLDPELAGVFAHEAVGHASEGDLVLEGSSVLQGMVGERIGAEALTIVDDPTLPEFGFEPMDAEGVLPRRTEIISANRRLMTGIVAFGVAALAFVGLSVLLVTRDVTRSLDAGVEAADRLAQGDLTVVVEARSGGEIGQLLGSMHSMVEKWRGLVTGIKSAAGNVAAGYNEIYLTLAGMAAVCAVLTLALRPPADKRKAG